MLSAGRKAEEQRKINKEDNETFYERTQDLQGPISPSSNTETSSKFNKATVEGH